jgi:hypothetical protein
MAAIIQTTRGVYAYEPVPLYFGRKPLDPVVSRNNLVDLVNVLEAAHVHYGIAYGTLLGSVRDHGFIKGDEDTDLCVHEEDKDKVLDSLFDLRKVGLEVARYEGELLSVIRNDDYIDMYFFKKSLLGNRYSGNLVLRRRHCTLEGSITFLDHTFRSVTNPVDFLRTTYGPSWRIPQPGKKGHTKRAAYYVLKAIKARTPKWLLSLYRHAVRWIRGGHSPSARS